MGKGKPFLEIFTLALNEDYRFPVLEFFVFLYSLGSFISVWVLTRGFEKYIIPANEGIMYEQVVILAGPLLFIFLVLVLKNIAYGLGSDLEKGVIQTLLSYPIKRWKILTAKLLSAVGISLLLFLGIQALSFYLLDPVVAIVYFKVILLAYAAQLSLIFLLSGIVLFLTLISKRGGLALVLGIILHFIFGTISTFIFAIVRYIKSNLVLKAYSLINPILVLELYFKRDYFSRWTLNGRLWIPSFSESLLYLGASYVIVIVIFALSYIYFERRLWI